METMFDDTGCVTVINAAESDGLMHCFMLLNKA